MFVVLRTDEFAEWLDDLKDSKTRARLLRRLERAEQGNLGDVSPVGDKSTQAKDIAKAKKLAAILED